MPSLKQIQDYIKNRRSQIGDYNNLDELKAYVDYLIYNPDITNDDELFSFGEDLGIGSEESPFHLGFTSRKLLSNLDLYINNDHKGVFHLDATYKIVKYCYPLIVLGLTDIQRQFFLFVLCLRRMNVNLIIIFLLRISRSYVNHLILNLIQDF